LCSIPDTSLVLNNFSKSARAGQPKNGRSTEIYRLASVSTGR
jgi:hypothetical protein